MKPRVGINLDFKKGNPDQLTLNATYYDALVLAGASPVLLAPCGELELKYNLSCLDGLLMIGGKDYHPSLYGEKASQFIDPADPIRQIFDIKLMKSCLALPNLPLLGICGGHQLLNISLGGTLIQDITTQVPHSDIQHRAPEGCAVSKNQHEVLLVQGSLVEQIYASDRITVPSSHHQAVKRLGNGLQVAGRAPDGVVEAIELTSRSFTLGVQWHPERDNFNHSVLFDAFVEACRADKSFSAFPNNGNRLQKNGTALSGGSNYGNPVY